MMEYRLAYLLVRLALASSMLGHGMARFSKLQAFNSWMVVTYQNTMIPSMVVSGFSSMLPFLEFVIGLMILLGLFNKASSFIGGLIMSILVFGSCLIESWEWLPSQFIHVLFFVVLLAYSKYNCWCIDLLFVKKDTK